MVGNGVAASRTEIVKAINWNKTNMSLVMAGKMNVPVHVYRKFVSHYNLKENTANEAENAPNDDLRGKLISSLERENKLLADQVSLAKKTEALVMENRAVLMTLLGVSARVLSKLEKKPVLDIAVQLNKETEANLKKVGIL